MFCCRGRANYHVWYTGSLGLVWSSLACFMKRESLLLFYMIQYLPTLRDVFVFEARDVIYRCIDV